MKLISGIIILILFFGQSYSQVNLNAGLRAYYTFDGNVNDQSGNANNPSQNNTVYTTDRFGNANKAVRFDGTGSFIRIPNAPTINTGNQISLCAWVRPLGFYQGTCHGNSILMKGDADYLPGNYLLRFDDNYYTSGNNCTSSVVDPDHQNFYGQGTNPGPPGYTPYIQAGQWYSVIYTYDGSIARLYINCELKDSTPSSIQSFSNSADLYLGKLNNPSYPYWFNGDMDDVRIYDRAINTDEVNVIGGCRLASASFTAPDTVCINTPVQVQNTSTGASTYYWTFCETNTSSPLASDLGNFAGQLQSPVFSDIAQDDNGIFFGFISNNTPGSITRLSFGNSLLNIPTAQNLGNFGGIIPNSSEGIQVIKVNGNWTAIMVGGDVAGSRILKLDFGNSLSNTPTATNWGNIGSLVYPHDLHVFTQNNNWYGYTVNANDNTITKFTFGTDFSNPPTATNIGNLGSLSTPVGIGTISLNGNWYMFITNAANSTLTRLDFGNSLLNTPAAVNIGNPGNLANPRDISFINLCDGITALSVNATNNTITKLDFGTNITGTPSSVSLGNPGNLNFPHSLSEIFRENNDIFTLIPNVNTNSITRLRFAGCSGIPGSTQQNPGAISYTQAGTYNINLLTDIGLPTQGSYCKPIVVINCLQPISQIINDYTPVLALNPCNNSLTVEDASEFGIGDTVLVIQMKGADIDSTNTIQFGDVININGAGNYEFNYVSQKTGNILSLRNRLTRTYNIPNGKVQLVRVPYYNSISVTDTLTCLPWDGSKGGVLAFHVRDTLQLNANIDVSGKGFRGGMGMNTLLNSTNCGQTNYFFPSSSLVAASKGEGIASISNNISSGRGPLANGGGGGQDHNSGGGGGGNGAVGGLGGYQWQDCTGAVDNRGLGGKVQAYSNAINKIFLGGGGGAGHCNNLGFNSNGGNGGGIIIIRSDKIRNNGYQIISKGAEAAACTPNGNFGYCHEGMGGGGSAGTILLEINTAIDAALINTTGGNGGSMSGEDVGKLGPGGGGSGGVTWFKSATQPTNFSVLDNGGSNGVNINIGNDPFGATPGNTGIRLFELKLPLDTVLFSPNIDSVRIKDSATACRSFNFNGLGYTNSNPIASWQWSFGDGGSASTQNTTHTYSNTGTYNVQLIITDINGCKDSIIKPVVVTALPVTSTTTQSICSSQAPYSWNGQSYSNTGSYQVTLTASSGCDSIATLNLTVNPVRTSQTNVSICTNQAPYSWNGQSYTNSGNYSVTLTGSNGCDSIANLSLTINTALSSTTNTAICPAQLPYSWNGQTITGTGTYTATLTSSGGCDSIATLNLAVNQPTSSQNSVTVCSNQAPYTWNGQSLTSTGTYNATLTGVNGCDSVASLNLTINPVRTSQTSVTICSNQAPYIWNGQSYSNSGSYPVTLTAANNCDSIATLNLTVNPVRTSQSVTSICSNQAPYTWNGQSLSSTGSYSITLTGSNGCDSIANLSLTVNATATSITQTGICTNQLPYVWNGQTILSGGTYSVNLSGSNGCDSIATLQLSVGNSVSSITNTNICRSQLPYSWNSQSINTAGSYTATLVSSGGCDSIATLNLSLFPDPLVQTLTDTSTCLGTPITLTTTGGFTSYQWSPGTAVNDSTISSPVFTGNGNQYSLIIQVTDNNGCRGSDTVQVTNNPLPTIQASGDTSICSSQPLALNATGANSYQWSPATGLSNPGIANPVFSSNSPQSYVVTGTDANGCKGTDTVSIGVRTVNAMLQPPYKAICRADSVQLEGYNGSDYLYTWSPADGLNNTAVENPMASPDQTTSYTVSITDTFCRFTRDFTVVLTVNLLPNVEAGKSNDINCRQRQARLSATGALQYTWNPSSTLSSTTIPNPVVNPTITTSYVVTGTDQNGCKNSDTIVVSAKTSKDAYAVPNAFTPNGDGLNDCFGIKGWSDATDVRFIIWNRFGEKVFETNNINDCWDGRFKGNPADVGNYVYYISALTPCGYLVKKDNLVLFR